MKTFKKTSLPEFVEVNGKRLTLNADISSAMSLNGTHPSKIAKELRKQGRTCALVLVLSGNLRGRTDLHGKPYQPSKFIFTHENLARPNEGY